MNIFNHPTQFIRVLSILQKLRNVALLFQQVEVFENNIQFAVDAS